MLTLLVPVLLLTTTIRLEMNGLGLYVRGFQLYDVSATTGLSNDTLAQAAIRIIGYFNSLVDNPQMIVTNAAGTQFELFHDYELIHLADVRLLFAANSVAQAACLCLVVVLVLAGFSFGRIPNTLAGLRRGAAVTLVLLTVTGAVFLADFGRMFTVFHLVAFDNPFWLLDPYTDYLVMLFPFPFWQDMFLLAGAGTAFSAILLYVIAARVPRCCHQAPGPSDTKRDV